MNLEIEPGEPIHTIHVARWQKALARLRELTGEERELMTELLAHVAWGWKHVRKLQLACEHALDRGKDRERQVLSFIEADVVDTFRALAFDAALLVPGWDGWNDAADPGDMDGDAGVFNRYLGVLRVASGSAEISAPLRNVIVDVSESMDGWESTFTRLLRRIDQVIIMPLLSEQDSTTP